MTATVAVLPRSQPRPAPAGHNIVTVASGKGGVGKTWLSITLAHALAQAGGNTLLFDGDLGLANVDVQLGLSPRHDLGGVLSGKITLADAVTRFDAGGFDIIAGRSGSGTLAALETDRIRALRDSLAVLSGRYDHVIVDLGAGIDAPVRLLTAGAGTILAVTTDEPTALTDAYAFIKITRMKHPAADIRIVVNQAASRSDGRRTFDTLAGACRQFLKFEPVLAGIIQRDDKVKESIRRQTALLTRHPAARAAEDVAALANHLRSGA